MRTPGLPIAPGQGYVACDRSGYRYRIDPGPAMCPAVVCSSRAAKVSRIA
ncbi:hypothetical protein ABZ281_24585 [Streptomyces sp. NPDC006265]